MNKRLSVAVILGLGLQAVTAGNNFAAAQTISEPTPLEATAQDEVWGIGRRVVQPERPSSSSGQAGTALAGVADLEMAFWACDYIATTRGVEATPVAMCSAVYDELKAMKFAGDFGELLDWWKLNKAVEHQKIASEQWDTAAERVDMRY